MILRIVRKEFTEMWRDGRFRLAAGIVLGLLLLALGLGWAGARQAERERAEADRADRAEWLAQGKRSPHSAAHFGRYAFKPATPLAFLDKGVNSYLGTAVWMEAHYQNPFRFRSAEDATSLQRFGELTAAVVMQLLIPLLIVLLAFSQLAGERERGTLRQLLSLGVQPGVLATGKALGVAVALGVVLVPAVLLGVAALSVASPEASVSWSLDRFLLLALAYLLYFGATLGIALAVSASVRSSRVALLALFSCWMVGCLIVPRLAADVAELIHPAPTYAEFQKAVNREFKDAGMPDTIPDTKKRAEIEQRALVQYNVTRAEDLPVNFDAIYLQEAEVFGNQVYDKHYGDLWDIFERQNRIQALSAVVAPLSALRPLSMGLSGTDFAQHRDFARAAETYRRSLVERLNLEMRDKAGKTGYSYLSDAELWRSIPDFTYAAPGTSRVLGANKLNIALLVFWFVTGCIAAIVAIGRMKAV